MQFSDSGYRGLFATDFDGTLLTTDKRVTPAVFAALGRLEEEKVLRVIATGRSLYSLFTVIGRDFPVEYVVFSSGAGVLRMKDGKVLMSRRFDERETAEIAEYLLALSVDFMIHHPVPENHRFFYHFTGGRNDDFHRRRQNYEEHAEPYDPEGMRGMEASEFLVVDPHGMEAADRIEKELGDRVSVVRATSPLDHASFWIEIFPPATDKGNGILWLASRCGLEAPICAAVGNDYNDLHMLEWADQSFVVENAPGELRRRFEVVPSCDEDGMAEAAERWLTRIHIGADGRGGET